jgi:hypothetical protein
VTVSGASRDGSRNRRTALVLASVAAVMLILYLLRKLALI